MAESVGKRIQRGARGLNKVERAQARDIAKTQLRLRSETKHRAWLYPKTTYSELQHNKPFFLLEVSTPSNGALLDSSGPLLNLAKGDDSIVHPNGGALPYQQPGSCREGQQIRLQSLNP